MWVQRLSEHAKNSYKNASPSTSRSNRPKRQLGDGKQHRGLGGMISGVFGGKHGSKKLQ